jgi:hypothetical protein
MKNTKIFLYLITLLSITIQIVPMAQFAKKAARKTTKAICYTVAGIGTTTAATLVAADAVATEFNKVDPNIFVEEKGVFLENYGYTTHNRKARKHVSALAARLGITPEDFSRIKVCHQTLSLEDNLAIQETTRGAEGYLKSKGLSNQEVATEFKEFRQKTRDTFCLNKNTLLATANILGGQRTNIIVIPQAFNSKHNTAIMHELTHLQRINCVKAAKLSERMKWWYLLYEEARADYGALKIANEQEIKDRIEEMEEDFAFKSGKKREVVCLVKTDNIESSYVFSHPTPAIPNWIENFPKPLQAYAKDAYVSLNDDQPHPPSSTRALMARGALLCRKMGL